MDIKGAKIQFRVSRGNTGPRWPYPCPGSSVDEGSAGAPWGSAWGVGHCPDFPTWPV